MNKTLAGMLLATTILGGCASAAKIGTGVTHAFGSAAHAIAVHSVKRDERRIADELKRLPATKDCPAEYLQQFEKMSGDQRKYVLRTLQQKQIMIAGDLDDDGKGDIVSAVSISPYANCNIPSFKDELNMTNVYVFKFGNGTEKRITEKDGVLADLKPAGAHCIEAKIMERRTFGKEFAVWHSVCYR